MKVDIIFYDRKMNYRNFMKNIIKWLWRLKTIRV